ncbi:UNVERIFIED_CONTAM: putative sulfate transporter 3.3 [Sesamum calycinum]|uniref:Sulfate transporter 3.3 n=1 Tax=Sesamum calycinum TaxID=2727403 RepID=A0AAW2J2D8_9LAMI
MEPNRSSDHHHEAVEIAMETEVHRVAPPPHRSTLEKLRTRLKETFFPDDPLRQFKGQSWKVKFILGAQYIFPILEWGPKYSLTLLKSDIVSGLTIASLAIPQGISYAKLANLPPIVGLYSSFVPPLIYAVLGSSRDLAVGPVSIASLIMGSMLRQQVSPAKDPILFLQLAFSSTFFAGLFQASLGFLRLGFIIDFLSKATLIGFMAGAAIIVSLQQLKSLLGITHFTKKMGIVPVLTSVFHNTHESMKKPKLFWVSAGAPLLSVILSTLLVFAFKAQNHGISVIGKLQEGLNPPSWNMLHFHGSYLGLVMKTGLVTGIISLTEGIAVGRTFAALKNYQVDGNKEMIAIGLMNIVGSSTSCYVTTGAFSRSAVNHNAGCKTAVSNIIMAVTVMVGISVFKVLLQITRPKTVMLGNIPGTDIYRNLHHYKEAVSIPGFLILSIEAPINFANTTYLKERVTRWIEEYETEDANAKKKSGVKFVILDLSAVSAIDTNGVSFFKDLKMALEKKNLEASHTKTLHFTSLHLLVLVNPVGEVIEKLQRADDAKELARPDCLFLTVGEAVTSLVSTVKSHSSNYGMLYISCLAIALSNAGTGSDLPYRIAVLPGGEGVTHSPKLQDFLFKENWKVKLNASSPKKSTAYVPDGKFLVSTGSGPGRIWTEKSFFATNTIKESYLMGCDYEHAPAIFAFSLFPMFDEVFGFCRFSRTTETDLVLFSQQCDVSLMSSEQLIYLYKEMFLAIEVLSSFLHTQEFGLRIPGFKCKGDMNQG